MTDSDRELARLREAFLDGASDAVPQKGDPDPETIWKAANGQLPPEQTRAILQRAIASPSCAREWILARRMSSEAEPGPVDATGSPRPYAAIAVAAGLLIAVTLATWIWAPDPMERTYRGEAEDLVSLVPHGSTISRNSATLEWEPVNGAREYILRVLGPDFGVIVMEEGLERPVFTIPEERLGDLEEGEEIQWQVEVVFSDGTRSLSKLFGATITSSEDGS